MIILVNVGLLTNIGACSVIIKLITFDFLDCEKTNAQKLTSTTTAPKILL